MMYFSLDYLLRQVSRWPGRRSRCHAPGGKSVEAASSVCGLNWHCVCQGAVRVPPNPCESEDQPQEAMGGNLSVDEHELCDPCAARLNNRNVAPEGCNFLRDGFDGAFNVPLTI
jgi:hypothetical protein